MILGQRSKLSLCQFFTLFSRDELILLLGKYGCPLLLNLGFYVRAQEPTAALAYDVLSTRR